MHHKSQYPITMPLAYPTQSSFMKMAVIEMAIQASNR